MGQILSMLGGSSGASSAAGGAGSSGGLMSNLGSALTSPQFTSELQQFQNSAAQGAGQSPQQGGVLSSNYKATGPAQPIGNGGNNSGILSTLMQSLGSNIGGAGIGSTLYNLGSNPIGFGQAYLKNMTSPGMTTNALISRQGG